MLQGMVPGFLVGFVPALWGKNTPVPQDPCPEPKKIACIPGPPVACLGLWNGGLEVDFEYWIVVMHYSGGRNYY